MARRTNRMSQLIAMEVGERRYFESSLAGFQNDMRALNPAMSRRPAALLEREFSTELLTAIGRVAGDIRYLICVERMN